jgi:cytosine/uracil/thiamine/allantoin permease
VTYPPAPPPVGQFTGVPAAYPFGPPGKIRGIGACIGLAIITLSVYTFVWTWKTHEEIKRNSGVGVGGPLGFVIYFVISPVTYFLLPSEIGQMMARYGRPSRVRGITGLWLLLPVVGSIVWFVKVQGQLNDHWRALGATG